MNDLALTVRQVTYENRSFWRNPASAFFTFVFPIMFMIIFNLIFGSSKYSPFGSNATVSQFYTPALMAFSTSVDQAASVREDVARVRAFERLGHLRVGGFLYDVGTGRLDQIA